MESTTVSQDQNTTFEVRITGNSIHKNGWIAWKPADLKVTSLADISSSLNNNVQTFDSSILFNLITDRIGKNPDEAMSCGTGESKWFDINYETSTPNADQLRITYKIGGHLSNGEYKLEKGHVDIKR